MRKITLVIEDFTSLIFFSFVMFAPTIIACVNAVRLYGYDAFDGLLIGLVLCGVQIIVLNQIRVKNEDN